MRLKDGLLIALGGTYPIIVAIASLARLISNDVGIALILLSFAPALFPMILNNRRSRTAQSPLSTVTTAHGEFSIAAIFLVMALMVSFWISLLLGVAWAILEAQSFLYNRKKPGKASSTPIVISTAGTEPDDYE